MVVTLTSTEGITTEIKGGVAHVTNQPVLPPTQQVIGPDPLADAAHVIENLKDEKTAISNMHALMLDQAMNWFQIGGTLLMMKENGWFADHASFGEMTWSEFGFKKSKAYYLIGLYETMTEAGVTWEDVKEIGWSKLRLLCSKAHTAKMKPHDFSTCVEKVKAAKMTYLEVEALLKSDLTGTGDPKPTTLVFKPHADQVETIQAALDKAKSEGGTENNTVALEYVCIEYVAPSKKKAAPVQHAIPDLKAVFADCLNRHDGDVGKSITEIFDAFAEVYPDVAVTVVLPDEA